MTRTNDTLGAEVEAAARALRWLAEDQETRSHGPAYLDSVADLIERLHREGEEARQRQPMIVTPCPSCGRRHLFIGSGGHLTCSLIDCKEPSAEDAVDTLRTRLQEVEAERDEAKAHSAAEAIRQALADGAYDSARAANGLLHDWLAWIVQWDSALRDGCDCEPGRVCILCRTQQHLDGPGPDTGEIKALRQERDKLVEDAFREGWESRIYGDTETNEDECWEDSEAFAVLQDSQEGE